MPVLHSRNPDSETVRPTVEQHNERPLKADVLAIGTDSLQPVSRVVAAAALLPNLLVGAALFGVPLALVLFYAFGTLDFQTLGVRWGWSVKAVTTALEQPYVGTLLDSLGFAAATVVTCAVFGFAIALVIVHHHGWQRSALFILVIFPFWTSFVVRTYAWTNLLGRNGPVADFTALLGHRVTLLGTYPGIVIGMIAAYLPMMILPIYVSLERVPMVLVEAARDLGANDRRILRTVYIPGALPGIGTGALLVGIPACGEYVVPQILGQGKVELIGNVIGAQMQQTGNYPLGSAMTGLLLTILVAILLLVWCILRAARSRQASHD